MTSSTTCCDGPCDCGTSTITRLRYSYGQRLTAVDLHDEQTYHRSKDRFVSRYVLGYGILCGLRGTRGDGPPDLTPTLRVSRGAAIDPCGNAVVVGTDQCVDVAAWYAANRAELGWDLPGEYPAWIGLRYRECPADPVAVPSEPCGCSREGCAYSRVHESFELALHALDGPIEPAPIPTGPCDSPGGPSWESPVHCPDCDCDKWLFVADVGVQIDDLGAGALLQATDVTDPDNEDPRRVTLHSLQSVQDIAVRLAADAAPCGSGPRVGAVGGRGDLDEDGDLEEAVVEVGLVLATDDDGAIVPLESGTLADPPLALARVEANGWEDVAIDADYDEATATLRARSDDVELGRPYRLSIPDGGAGPPVDQQLQSLRPAPWSVVVRWIDVDEGVVVQATS